MHDLLFDDLVIKMNLSLIADRNHAVLNGKKSMVFPHGNILTGKSIGTALTHQYRANFSRGTRRNLDAQILWIGIPIIF